jgi:iron complex outermembrane receptor protein
MISFNKRLLMACSAVSAIVCAVGAPAVAADAPQASAEAGQVVVVTANRRSESVQNVGGQVTALTGADLANMHAQTFNDFATSVPGLTFQANSPTNNLIAIRGVASSTAELGSAVSVYLDDVPLGASTQFGLGSQSFNFNLFDMDRVEVLNGPQGTLYGANALGGAIKYVTAKPQMGALTAKAEFEGSNTDHGSANGAVRLMVNAPLFGDTAAIRVDGLSEYNSGYTRDPDNNRTHIGQSRALGGRVSFEDHLTPDVDLRVTAFTQNIAANGLNVAFRGLTTHSPTKGPYDQSYVLAQPSDNSVSVYSGELNWNLHWSTLTFVSAYQRNHGTYHTDDSGFYDVIMPLYTGVPATGTFPYDLYVDTNTKKVTEEVRLASPNNKTLEWVVGGYYTRETTDELVDLFNAASPSGNLPAPFSSFPFYGFLPSTYREEAGFGDLTYYFNPKLDVTLGVRYSHQHQNYSSNIWWIGFGPPYGHVYPYSSTSDQGVTTYLVNPRYHLTKDVMLYARASSGFRPGGPNFVLPTSFHSPAPSNFNPDRIWNYELGEKGRFFDGRLTLDADVYDIEWKAIQTTQNINGINQLVNAGNARIKGAEASFSLKVTPPLTVSGSAAYTDANLTSTAPVLGVNYTGARLPLSPKTNFAVTATYRFDLSPGYSGMASLSDVYVGDRTSGYAKSFTNVLYTMPSYNTVNLNLSLYLPNNMELDAYAKNLTDTRGQLSANTLNNVFNPAAGVPVTLQQPLTVGVVMKLAFGR